MATGHDCPDCPRSFTCERGLNVHRTRKHPKPKGKPRSQVRSNHTDRAKALFLEVFAEVGTVAGAVDELRARDVRVNRRTLYEWRDRDDAFADAWDVASDAAADILEKEARRRAVDGVDDPVFFEGVEIKTRKRYSDRLLEFLLKGRRPEVFGDRLNIGPRSNVREGEADELLEVLKEIAARKASAPNPNAVH